MRFLWVLGGNGNDLGSWVLSQPLLASFLCLDMVYLAALAEFGGWQRVFRQWQSTASISYPGYKQQKLQKHKDIMMGTRTPERSGGHLDSGVETHSSGRGTEAQQHRAGLCCPSFGKLGRVRCPQLSA